MSKDISKHRVEALSDGVFAIAMTLLVLDIKVPAATAPGELSVTLAKDIHSWISFAVTFLIASIFWVLQHRLFDVLENVTVATVIPSFVFLCFVSIVPFSTSLWGHHSNDSLALAVYFGNQMAIAIALTVQLEVARIKGHLRAGAESQLMRFRLYGMSSVMLIAFLCGCFVPVRWIWPVPVLMAVTARIMRRKWEKRVYAAEGTGRLSTP